MDAYASNWTPSEGTLKFRMGRGLMSHIPCYVRCGSAACKWQIALIDLSESELERLRGAFRKHCIESHGLRSDDTDRQAWFDLEKHTMTLMSG